MVFKRLQSDINILPLIKEVAENFDDFNIFTNRQKSILVQKETMSIELIKGVPRDNKSHETENTKLYYKYDECRYFLDWFQNTYGGQIYRVLIVHLQKDGIVYPHVDVGDYYENKDRFHLVLSGYYDFTVGEETQRFGAGELFWFDNKKLHSTKNVTPITRISLIFDAKGCKF